MNESNAMALPPRRRDDESDWHDLVVEECPHCDCEFSVAKDDPSIVWDPGRAWEEAARTVTVTVTRNLSSVRGDRPSFLAITIWVTHPTRACSSLSLQASQRETPTPTETRCICQERARDGE